MKAQAVVYKGSDKEGRVRLGNKYSDQQWQVTEYDNGCLVLVPMVPATDIEAMKAFEKVFTKHKKTMDALK